jgi:hypothetical protein
MKKIYVNPKQQITLTCDHCQHTYTAKVPLHIRSHTPIKVKCRCGSIADVLFEFRQAYRKTTSLQGLLRLPATDVTEQAAQIRNLSRDGLQLTIRRWRHIDRHDIIAITFVLDNPQRSHIDKRAMVKYIDKQVVGAQFCPEDQLSYQKEIGFYLMGQGVPRETGVDRVAPSAPVSRGYV